MEGTFEVHIITTADKQTELFAFITDLNNTNITRPRPTCAVAKYGDYPVQPMLTFWCHGTLDKVNNIADEIIIDMINQNIPIIRTKIEAMAHNKGVPDVCTGEHYFEFHFKVAITSTKDWNDIVHLITPFGAHLFYNPYNKTMTPVVTIRRYTSLTDLEKVYQEVKHLLEDKQFTLTPTEKEYSVYDSDVNLDKNWLFEDTPQNFICDVRQAMLFAQ